MILNEWTTTLKDQEIKSKLNEVFIIKDGSHFLLFNQNHN